MSTELSSTVTAVDGISATAPRAITRIGHSRSAPCLSFACLASASGIGGSVCRLAPVARLPAHVSLPLVSLAVVAALYPRFFSRWLCSSVHACPPSTSSACPSRSLSSSSLTPPRRRTLRHVSPLCPLPCARSSVPPTRATDLTPFRLVSFAFVAQCCNDLKAGLKAAHYATARALGPNKTLISNSPTPETLQV